MMTEEHKAYLDKFRDSGTTNMYFATDRLSNKFIHFTKQKLFDQRIDEVIRIKVSSKYELESQLE